MELQQLLLVVVVVEPDIRLSLDQALELQELVELVVEEQVDQLHLVMELQVQQILAVVEVVLVEMDLVDLVEVDQAVLV
tara:strand:+ start:256 stop:492 length:237 start_codon:yes stop_codon:yes gene_type:complete